jgi:hypothetical protein
MTAELLEKVRGAGLTLQLTELGRVQATGAPDLVNSWFELLQDNRVTIADALREESTKNSLTDDEEAILFAWLIADGDTVEGAREVIDCCRRDPQSREFFLKEALK